MYLLRCQVFIVVYRPNNGDHRGSRRPCTDSGYRYHPLQGDQDETTNRKVTNHHFLPCDYAKYTHGIAVEILSVCPSVRPSVCPSVCQTRVL